MKTCLHLVVLASDEAAAVLQTYLWEMTSGVEGVGRGGGLDLQTQLKFIDCVMVFISNSSLIYVFAGSSSSLRKVSFQKHFSLPCNYY